MFDHFITIATAAVVTMQVAVGTVFFGALAFMTLRGFDVVPSPF